MFAGFVQACPGMPNVLQDNKFEISMGKVEPFCLFVACRKSRESFPVASREATLLSYRFSWVWSDMPKVI